MTASRRSTTDTHTQTHVTRRTHDTEHTHTVIRGPLSTHSQRGTGWRQLAGHTHRQSESPLPGTGDFHADVWFARRAAAAVCLRIFCCWATRGWDNSARVSRQSAWLTAISLVLRCIASLLVAGVAVMHAHGTAMCIRCRRRHIAWCLCSFRGQVPIRR